MENRTNNARRKEADCDLEDMFGSSSSDRDEDTVTTESLLGRHQQDQDMLDMFGSPPTCHRNSDGRHSSEGVQQVTVGTCTSTHRRKEPDADTRKAIQRKRVAEAILVQNQKKQSKQSQIPPDAVRDKKKSLTTTNSSFYQTVKMDHYWKNLLDWNFVRDLNVSQQNTLMDNVQSTSDNTQHDPLPDTFGSAQEYKARWAPLLLQEVRSQILSEVSSEQVPLWSRGAAMGAVLVEPCRPSNDNTIILLLRTKQGQSNEVQAYVNDVFCLVPDAQTLMDAAQGKLVGNATTENKRLGILGLGMIRTQTLEGLRLKVSFKQWQKIGKRDMIVTRVGSNVTSLREFTALSRMESILLKRSLLSCKDSAKSSDLFGDLLSEGGGEKALGVGFRIYVKAKFNPSQIRAITAAASEYGRGGFTLVKGPPGTGKTTTLVALLNALHLRQYQIYYQEIERIATTAQTSSMDAALDGAAKVKPRILVCAPSNAAVDNVILKITKERFVDGNGGRYNPSIVRIGTRQSTKVNNVSIQTQMDAVLVEGTDQCKLESLVSFCKAELKRFKSEIRKLQERLRALAEASPWPLSQDWEIRIDEETFEKTKRVVFVNHRLKKTTLATPPPPASGEESYPPEKMPHYRSLMDTLVQYVERHNSTTSKLRQYRLVQTTNQCIARDGRYSHAAAALMEELETHIINTCHICLTTLGSAGSRKIESAQKFEVVVVDEAAQSSEPASLVALQLGSSHAVLMGDPQQLPATIFSLSGRTTRYDRSLFQRLEDAGHPVHMLDTQYRMDPAISDFPRRIFYGGLLKDGPNVKNPQYGGVLRQTIASKFPHFRAFTILDLDSAEERDGTSLSNAEEVALALHLYSSLEKETCGMLSKCQVAVITPYSQQVALMRKKFTEHFGSSTRMPVEISTIDAFQGKEADVVIFSCVRAAGRGVGIGFLSDVKRMNVALTRAKHYLFVIASIRTIIVNPYWRDLVKHARERRSVVRVPMTLPRNSKQNRGFRAMRGQDVSEVPVEIPDLRSLKALHPTLAANRHVQESENNELSDGDFSA